VLAAIERKPNNFIPHNKPSGIELASSMHDPQSTLELIRLRATQQGG